MRKIKTIVLFFTFFAAVSCQKDPITSEPSATDPLPFPIDVNKDLSTSPGDDFWQYCNGGWYEQASTPSTGAIGGMYDQSITIDKMVQTVTNEDPSLKQFFQLSDELYAHSDDATDYLNALKAKYSKPATKEDCLRLFGRMIMDGISPVALTLLNDFKDGQMIGLLTVPNDAKYKYTFDQMPETVKGNLRLIVEGMGMNPEDLYYNDKTITVMDIVTRLPLDELYSPVEGFWSKLYPYVSQDLNASLDDKALSPDQVRNKARAELNYLISNRLAVKYITPDLKNHFRDLMERLRDAYRERINNLEWMSETTRKNALTKLEKMTFYVGSPDDWYQDCLPDLSQCCSLLEAVHKLMAAKALLYKHLIGTNDYFSYTITESSSKVTGEILLNDLTMINSFYLQENNAIVIMPALMVPPVIRTDYSEAYQYGTIVLIAHEITHAFDSNGSRFDALGHINNWWTVADKMAFEDEQEKLIQCYNNLEYDPVGHPREYTDGEFTLAENIADLGGFLIARDAYIKRLQEQGFSGENYNAQLRKFHEAFASTFCMKYSQEKLTSIIEMDNHSHCRLRVNGVVMNTDLWYELYNVNRNNILFLPQERRAHIW